MPCGVTRRISASWPSPHLLAFRRVPVSILDAAAAKRVQRERQCTRGSRLMQDGTIFSGIECVHLQDQAITESMGSILDHAFELGVRQTGDTLLCARADGEAIQPRSLTLEFYAAGRSAEGLPACAVPRPSAQPRDATSAGRGASKDRAEAAESCRKRPRPR
jgi:hypothetical protein